MMPTIESGYKTQTTLEVKFAYSLLWEAALGIAAITNKSLTGTLEHFDYTLEEGPFSPALSQALNDVQKHNTWKALLQLLHANQAADVKAFLTAVSSMSETALRYHCLPYIGEENEQLRIDASQQNSKAIEQLRIITNQNPFFPSYIHYISTVSIQELTDHLENVLTLWYQEMIRPEQLDMLTRDISAKEKQQHNLDLEAYIHWVTNGSHYTPEPDVTVILFIPHYSYRPWTVTADLPGTKVFYYPIASSSIHPADHYAPDTMLTRRYKALGDENRLRLLKLIFEQERSLQSLTESFEIAKSTLHHHLKLLKSARLITNEKNIYRFNRLAANKLDNELLDYLKREHNK